MKVDFSSYDMSREEKMEHWFKKINILAGIDRKKFFDEASERDYGSWCYCHGDFPPPLHLHNGMFKKTIAMLGTEEQSSRIMPQLKALKVIGCYG